MSYEIIELKRAKKFIKKHENDKSLIYRIHKKYIEISENPYKSDFNELRSDNCPKCQRAKIGNYRIVFYRSRDEKIIYIIDIFHRKNNYQNY